MQLLLEHGFPWPASTGVQVADMAALALGEAAAAAVAALCSVAALDMGQEVQQGQ